MPMKYSPMPTTIPTAVLTEANIIRYLLIRWPTSSIVRVVRLILPRPKRRIIRSLMSSRLIIR